MVRFSDGDFGAFETSGTVKLATVLILLFASAGNLSGAIWGSAKTFHLQQESESRSEREASATESANNADANGQAPVVKSEEATESRQEEAAEESEDAKRTAKLNAARQDAENAPQQPFFNHWFWLVAIALTLVVISYIPRKAKTELLEGESEPESVFDTIQRFAFRFTALYFTLFFFPAPLSYIPYVGSWVSSYYMMAESAVVTWVAEGVLRISSDFVPYSGSGDSTESFVKLLSKFTLAMGLAMIWSLIDRRKTDHRILKDLFHSNITYVLALTMLGYGLAKVGYARNQFSIISGSTLESTWGDTSPMGVVWKFMGASRPYTIFAGMGESVGALLLVFRRTRTLGALVLFGVLTNVVMLNYCYDVPVKINSTHLALLALCLAMREMGRLGNVLFFNRPTQLVDQRPPYTGPRTVWLQRAIKAAAVVMWIGMPIYAHVVAEIEHARRPADPEFFGTYGVEEFRVAGEIKSPEADETWERVRLLHRNMGLQMEPVPTNWLIVKTKANVVRYLAFSIEENKIVMGDSRGATFEVPDEMTIAKTDDGNWQLTGDSDQGAYKVILRGFNDADTRLMGRGFRWINETPFNR